MDYISRDKDYIFLILASLNIYVLKYSISIDIIKILIINITRLFNQIEYLKSKLINININYKYGEHGNLLKIVYFSLQSWWF